MVNKLIKAMEEAIAAIKKYPSLKISLFHHNDTDGLSSGAILLNAFEKIGYAVSRFSLEKPYPQVLEKILKKQGRIVIFADFAGKIAPLISSINEGRNLVLILDHHPAEKVDDPFLFNLDGDLYGLKGDRDISASAACYLFADSLLRSRGLTGSRDAHLGALGAIGDGFFVDGALSGVNKEVLKTAVDQKGIRVVPTSSGEVYYIRLGGREYPAADICITLDALGGVGYYDNGAARGIEVCQSGVDKETEGYIEELKLRKESIFAREIENLKNNIQTTARVQWFNVKDRFKPMGVKMIGVFCSVIKDRDFLDETKYLAGFQHVPQRVPGFGNIDFNAVKISMRVSQYLTDRIRGGQIPGLSSFLPEATERLKGFSDACHGLSAATTVKIGQEELLIKEIEKVLIKSREYS